MTRDVLVLCTRRVVITLTNALRRSRITGNRIDPPGKTFLHMVRVEEVKGNTSTHPDQPRASSHINDNYCINVLQTGLLAGSQETVQSTENLSVKTILTHCCKSCTFCTRPFTKDRCKSCYCKLSQNRIKICERCFLCRSIVFCQACNQCPNCCTRTDSRGKTTKFLENLGKSGCRSKSVKNIETRLHPPLSHTAKLDKITNPHKLLCQSPQEPLPAGGITSAYGQKCS